MKQDVYLKELVTDECVLFLGSATVSVAILRTKIG